MRNYLSFILAFALFFSPSANFGAIGATMHYDLNFPERDARDYGGRLGIEIGSGFEWQGIPVLKVTKILPGSPLAGIIFRNDFIYGIDEFYLRNGDDIVSIVSTSEPGTEFTVYFIDSRHNFKQMEATIESTSDDALDEAQIAFNEAISDVTTAKVPETIKVPKEKGNVSSGVFCDEHPYVCIGGIIVGALVVGAALSNSSSSNKSSTYSNSNNPSDSNTYYEQPNDKKTFASRPLPSAPPVDPIDPFYGSDHSAKPINSFYGSDHTP